MSSATNNNLLNASNDAQDPLGLVGTVVDQRVQLTIRKMVGSGTYASVYLATDQFGRRWAVKCMPRSSHPSDKHKRNNALLASFLFCCRITVLPRTRH